MSFIDELRKANAQKSEMNRNAHSHATGDKKPTVALGNGVISRYSKNQTSDGRVITESADI